jgi:hypothetical protein
VHTTIDLFFEDTCLQVIREWNIVISFIFWVIYDDFEVLQLLDLIDVYVCVDMCFDQSS